MADTIIDIVHAYYQQMEQDGPAAAAGSSLADDFRLIAGTVEINRAIFSSALTSLYAAIPDLTHTLSGFQQRGEVVQVTDLVKGTFTGVWDGSSFGLPVIAPHGKPFVMAPTKWEITVRRGKITRWHDVTVPSAASGLRGFYSALGYIPPVKRK